MLIRSIPHSIDLAPHPHRCSTPVHGVAVQLAAGHDGDLALTFSLAGELSRLRIPPPLPPRRANGLWRHTCFEVFVAAKGEAAYAEINLAPSGLWAAYAFRGYRDGAPLLQEMNPEIAVRQFHGAFELDAIVRLDRLLPPSCQTGRLHLGLSAVVEDEDGEVSYWALVHPPGRPDFHHRDAFALEFDMPSMAVVSIPAARTSR